MYVPSGFFEESEQSADRALELEDQHEDSHIQMTTAQFTSVTAETFIVTTNFTYIEEDADQLEFILMVLIPLILLALLFVSVVILVSRYKRKRTKQGKYSVCSHFQTIASRVNEQSIKQKHFLLLRRAFYPRISECLTDM